jgi:hypothetical protein
MMEAVSTSEMLVNINQTKWCCIPEDSHLHTHHCDNLKSHKSNFVWKTFTVEYESCIRLSFPWRITFCNAGGAQGGVTKRIPTTDHFLWNGEKECSINVPPLSPTLYTKHDADLLYPLCYPYLSAGCQHCLDGQNKHFYYYHNGHNS